MCYKSGALTVPAQRRMKRCDGSSTLLSLSAKFKAFGFAEPWEGCRPHER